MGANIAGIYGAQVFRADDRPRYRRAFTINLAILAFALLLAFGRMLDDLRTRRRKSRQVGPVIERIPSSTNDAEINSSKPKEGYPAQSPTA